MRSLFVVILAFAILFALARLAGYFVAIGTVLALGVLVWAIVWRRRGRFVFVRIGAALFSLAVIWFLAVDISYFVGSCLGCGYGRDELQYRVFCVPVGTDVSIFPTGPQVILDDLGVPCDHKDLRPWHKHRYWGLALCGYPCVNGTFRFVGDLDWYTEEMSLTLRQVAADDPEFAARLHNQVVHDHDYKGFWDTIDEYVEVPSGNSD